MRLVGAAVEVRFGGPAPAHSQVVVKGVLAVTVRARGSHGEARSVAAG
jgi:hypothetical protein